jgi:transposase-like protein
VPSVRPGLGVDEKAEAVRLARAGASMLAISRRMGVDRKGILLALVEVGVISDEALNDW